MDALGSALSLLKVKSILPLSAAAHIEQGTFSMLYVVVPI